MDLDYSIIYHVVVRRGCCLLLQEKKKMNFKQVGSSNNHIVKATCPACIRQENI